MADNRNPLDVLRKLHTELVDRRPTVKKAHAYYDGDHNLAFAGEKFRDAFGGLFRAFADNWCGVVANAPEERLQVNGFRVNQQPKADGDAKRLWEQNELDLQASMGHLDGLIGGVFYATVWKPEDGAPGRAEITIESALGTIVECHPKIRSRRTAALRTWLADDGYEHAELFFPDGVYLFRSKTKRSGEWLGDTMRLQWVIEDQLDIADSLDVDGRMPNPLGVVPVVEFINRPRLYVTNRVGWAAHSEIAAVMPLQDAVNKLWADLIVGAEFTALPQRNASGWSGEPILDDDGRPTGQYKKPTYRAGPGDMVYSEDEKTRFGQFEAADLTNLTNAIGTAVQHIAAISATPPHYLDTSADRLSGESIKSAESGLIAKVRRKCTAWGAGWEEVMRLAGAVAEIPSLAEADQMETIWRDPETRTEAEHIDALGKKAQLLNVPAPQLWEEAGYTPEQIARFPALRAQMQLEGMAANAAERARIATEESDRLRAEQIAATGVAPTRMPPALEVVGAAG